MSAGRITSLSSTKTITFAEEDFCPVAVAVLGASFLLGSCPYPLQAPKVPATNKEAIFLRIVGTP